MNEPRRQRATEAFFGRRKGKHLRDSQRQAMAELLPRIGLDLDTPPPRDLAGLWPVAIDTIRMEIGFGAGEHLLHRVSENPRTGFIGVEPFVNSMGKFLLALQDRNPDNVRVYTDDATRVLDWLPSASLDRIDLLYPDPWPKKRHWKRRFVNPANIERFARVLKPGGSFCFASDIDTYVNWTLQHLIADQRFDWQAQSAADWQTAWAGWPGTRYEAKAIREGRTPAYLSFVRL
ncbi:tRNA (guanine(46)-N(7))-methyltransferase TrmB [Pseudohoeflea coraliihabitans]|uniref:tRNA (guanine-N(7)-)-methyltransferase n=1 Tax=Pseudohoeflea coraliihabitans TaxID=2860393 RepID=A0ABS6WNX2_9HYPH|nr:tRNA (guanine(46)-N(7))-methyltransferase TrmB [Pseudohoeflea sp. DP4N28-3]MBW3097648.1 tRNA (guanine(46)-N(7))-methyltransferase TrmB [Pseudohoeflea sp. DP4N28-3]